MRERLRGTAALLSGLTADHVARARAVAAEAAGRIAGGAARRVDRGRLQLQSAVTALNALSPLATLERGYAIVRSDQGKTVRSVRALEPGSAVDLVLRDGVASATVDRVTPNVADTPAAVSTSGSEP